MKIPKQTMTGNLLHDTGISQRTLATFLDIDHSLLTRYDKGTRSLPTAAMLQMAEMGKYLREPAPLPAPFITGKEQEDLLREAEWCRAKCYPLRKKLATIQLQQQQAVNAIQMVDALKTAPGYESEKRQRWLDYQRFESANKLAANGWLQQRKLEIAIELLEKEAALYEATANATL